MTARTVRVTAVTPDRRAALRDQVEPLSISPRTSSAQYRRQVTTGTCASADGERDEDEQDADERERGPQADRPQERACRVEHVVQVFESGEGHGGRSSGCRENDV